MKLLRTIVFIVFGSSVAVANASNLEVKRSEAIPGKDAASVEKLIGEGARVDVPDSQGRTPLLRAAENGHIDIVLKLIAAGADLNATDENGTSPLMKAAERGFTAIVIALLEAGADPDKRDTAGNNALHYASRGNDTGNVSGILYDYGASPPEKKKERGFAHAEQKYFTVPVYFATNRQLRPDPSPHQIPFFDEPDTSLHYGICKVSIPAIHEPGELEAPSIFRLEFSEDAEKHVVLQKTEVLGEHEFYSTMKRNAGQKEVLIFIHGYNVNFEKAARRTAQIVYDLQFTGVPLFFSWPSSGNILGYQDDAEKIRQSIPSIQSFIAQVITQFKPDRIHIIAHSMGTYGLTQALVKLSDAGLNKHGKPVFNQLILAAPDIDADVFRKEIAPKIARLAKRVSLYASSRDLAMSVSRRYNQGRRAGDSDPEILVAKGIDSIDVSQVDTSLVGHSYYGSNRSVITDIRNVLSRKKPEERDFLERRSVAAKRGVFWFFNQLKAINPRNIQ